MVLAPHTAYLHAQTRTWTEIDREQRVAAPNTTQTIAHTVSQPPQHKNTGEIPLAARPRRSFRACALWRLSRHTFAYAIKERTRVCDNSICACLIAYAIFLHYPILSLKHWSTAYFNIHTHTHALFALVKSIPRRLAFACIDKSFVPHARIEIVAAYQRSRC